MGGAFTRWVSRTGMRRGTQGGHWSWFVLAFGAHILNAERRREDAAKISMAVKPGERVLVSARRPAKRR